MEKTTKKRDSNIEIMRIFAMILITFNHVFSMTDVQITEIFPHANSLLLLFFYLGGKVGALVYVLAGGYFLMPDRKFKLNGIIRIWIPTFTYAVCLNLVDVIVFSKHFTAVQWIKACLPVTGYFYWFSSSYIITLLLIPVLRIITKYQKPSSVIAIVWTALLLVSTVTLGGGLIRQKIVSTVLSALGSGPIPFLYVIFILMYVRRYCPKLIAFFQVSRSLIAGILVYLLMFGLEIALIHYGIQSGHTELITHFSAIRNMNSLLCIASSFFIFGFFKRLKVPYMAVINKLASLVFGVYLLQCHSRIIWNEFFHFGEASKAYSPLLLILYSTAAVAVFFALGFAIESLRKLCSQKLENTIANAALTHKCEQKIDALYAVFGRLADRIFG